MSSPTPRFTTEQAQGFVDLAEFLLQFSRVERDIYHPDGHRRETDSDHTVMLAILCCLFAKEYEPQLDIGKVAILALVHDLVEGYAGDTSSFNLSEEQQQQKGHREQQALAKLDQQFGQQFPWLIKIIHDYESLSSPEAQFVKMFDKLMPLTTHILNRGAVLAEKNTSQEEMMTIHQANTIKYQQTIGANQPATLALRAAMLPLLVKVAYEDKS